MLDKAVTGVITADVFIYMNKSVLLCLQPRRQPAEQPARVLPGRADRPACSGRAGEIRREKHRSGAGAARLHGKENRQGEVRPPCQTRVELMSLFEFKGHIAFKIHVFTHVIHFVVHLESH